MSLAIKKAQRTERLGPFGATSGFPRKQNARMHSTPHSGTDRADGWNFVLPQSDHPSLRGEEIKLFFRRAAPTKQRETRSSAKPKAAASPSTNTWAELQCPSTCWQGTLIRLASLVLLLLLRRRTRRHSTPSSHFAVEERRLDREDEDGWEEKSAFSISPFRAFAPTAETGLTLGQVGDLPSDDFAAGSSSSLPGSHLLLTAPLDRLLLSTRDSRRNPAKSDPSAKDRDAERSTGGRLQGGQFNPVRFACTASSPCVLLSRHAEGIGVKSDPRRWTESCLFGRGKIPKGTDRDSSGLDTSGIASERTVGRKALQGPLSSPSSKLDAVPAARQGSEPLQPSAPVRSTAVRRKGRRTERRWSTTAGDRIATLLGGRA